MPFQMIPYCQNSETMSSLNSFECRGSYKFDNLLHRIVLCSRHSHKYGSVFHKCRYRHQCRSLVAWMGPENRPAWEPSVSWGRHLKVCQSLRSLVLSAWSICLLRSRRRLPFGFCNSQVCSQQHFPWSSRGISRPIINKLEIKVRECRC